MTGLDALHQGVVLLLRHGVDHVHAGLVDGQDVGRGEDTHIGSHYRLGGHALAVAGDGHVAHHIDIRYVLAEIVRYRLAGLGHALHELLLGDIPLVVLTGSGVDPGLADAAVSAADADVLAAAAETSLGMSLEMGENDHRVVVGDVAAHRHAVEPFAAFHRQGQGVLLVHDVHGAEGPSVDLQSPAVLLGGVAVADIVGIGLDNSGIRDIFLNQLLHPGARDNVRAVLLAGMQFHGHTAHDVAAYRLVGLSQSLRAEVTGKINNRLVAGTLLVGHILVAVLSGHWLSLLSVLGTCRRPCRQHARHHSCNHCASHILVF